MEHKCCEGWCRADAASLLPPFPQHHGYCPNYPGVDLVRVEFEGSSYLCRPEDAPDDPQYTLTKFRLSQPQIDALPEFTGF